MNDPIRFHLTADDYVEATRLYAARTSRHGPWIVVGVIWLIYAGLAFLIIDEWDWRSGAASAALGAAVAALVLMLLYRFTIPRRSRRIFAQQKSLHDEIEAKWDEAALDLATSSARSRHRWADFLKWTEGQNVILLYQSDAVFNMLPKRAFSPEALTEIRENLMREKVRQLTGWR